MKKTCLFFLMVGLIFTALLVVSASAQTGMPGGQCDPNPACDPTSGTCCGQCDPNPACVMDDPNAIPCCGAAGDPNASGMPGMGDHQGDSDHCAALHPGGAAAHVDPPESTLDAIGAEMEASCKAGNCGISEASYTSLTSLGHSRAEVDCFLAEGERSHPEQHGGGMPPRGEDSYAAEAQAEADRLAAEEAAAEAADRLAAEEAADRLAAEEAAAEAAAEAADRLAAEEAADRLAAEESAEDTLLLGPAE
jgi:hypothetical protein